MVASQSYHTELKDRLLRSSNAGWWDFQGSSSYCWASSAMAPWCWFYFCNWQVIGESVGKKGACSWSDDQEPPRFSTRAHCCCRMISSKGSSKACHRQSNDWVCLRTAHLSSCYSQSISLGCPTLCTWKCWKEHSFTLVWDVHSLKSRGLHGTDLEWWVTRSELRRSTCGIASRTPSGHRSCYHGKRDHVSSEYPWRGTEIGCA